SLAWGCPSSCLSVLTVHLLSFRARCPRVVCARWVDPTSSSYGRCPSRVGLSVGEVRTTLSGDVCDLLWGCQRRRPHRRPIPGPGATRDRTRPARGHGPGAPPPGRVHLRRPTARAGGPARPAGGGHPPDERARWS